MTDTKEDTNSAPTAEDLASRIAAANHQYSLKNYEAAAELYSKATEDQVAQNGEMALQNAELFYLYGRCLYHVAIGKSDVLGTKVAGETKSTTNPPNKRKRELDGQQAGQSQGTATRSTKEPLEQAILERAVEQKDGVKAGADDIRAPDKPFFQFTGDENWDDSDDDEEGEADGQAEEEEDDFATAYEILDVARILLAKTLEDEPASTESKGKGKATEESPERRELKERLADTHDLQAEISLENERFSDAMTEARAALALKEQLYPPESSLLAEAHWKLGLALEHLSEAAAKPADEAASGEGAEAPLDLSSEELRKEAADQVEAAIRSSKLRIEHETTGLDALAADDAAERRKGIAEVKEIIALMEEKLVELQSPPAPAPTLTSIAGLPGAPDQLRGILGGMLGESKAEQKARIEDAVRGANDLTASVRRRKKPKTGDEPTAAATVDSSKVKMEANGNSNGKRKASVHFESDGNASDSKKSKVEDA